MNRRDLLKRSALLGLAAGTPDLFAQRGPARTEPRRSARPYTPPRASEASELPAAFVVAPEAEVLDFAGPLEVFAGAYTREGKPLFVPYLVAATKEPVTVGGRMKVVPEHTFASAPQPKVIVIPALDMDRAASDMYEWIRTASRGTELTMSVCNGAFVLAKTGLLDGREATAHHGGYFRFAAMFPKVRLRRGARYVESGNVASSGGISSGIDLALRVVERYLGREDTAQVVDGMEYQGTGWLHPDSNEAYATLPRFDDTNPICPVCLLTADRALQASHHGKRYFFCSDSDKEFFEAHTDTFDRFLAEDARLSTR